MIDNLESNLERFGYHIEGAVGDHISCFQTIKELKEQVCKLQEANKILEDRLNACKTSQKETTQVDLETKKHGYTDNMMKCVHAIQGDHVGSAHTSSVIESVLKSITERHKSIRAP